MTQAESLIRFHRTAPAPARSASPFRKHITPAACCSTIWRAAMANAWRSTGPGGTRNYAQLCTEASQWGHGFLSLGLTRGDRILLFLDDTPAYPAAFFGAVRAGFVPLLINTLTPPDLLQFYLSDAGAAVAVADAEFSSRFNARGLQGHAAAHADRDQRRRGRACGGRHVDRRTMATRLSHRACRGRYRPQRDGVLDVLVRLDRPAQGHRPSAARHGL